MPDLGSNIKCGNSLIGPDFYSDNLFVGTGHVPSGQIDDEERMRINVFDWHKEFPEVFKSTTGHSEQIEESGPSANSGQGFDIVIGNPPYVFGGNTGVESIEKKYFLKKYTSGKGKINLFTIFIERSLYLTRKHGFLSFIIPNTFLRVTSYNYSRRLIAENYAIKEVIDLGIGIFKKVTTSSIIILIENAKPINNTILIKDRSFNPTNSLRQSSLVPPSYIINTKNSSKEDFILSKIQENSFPLGNICKEMIFGVVITKNKNSVVFSHYKKGLKRFLEGKDISRYVIHNVEKYLLYEPKLLHRPRTKEVFEVEEKILIQRITGGKRPLNAAYDNQQFYNKESINNIILSKGVPYNSKYILAIINSKLINWFYNKKFTNESLLTVNLSKEYLSQIPIKEINFQSQREIELHERIVELADKMIKLNISSLHSLTPQEKEVIQRQIDAIDKEIDRLVYELYGLTEEEIKIVESP